MSVDLNMNLGTASYVVTTVPDLPGPGVPKGESRRPGESALPPSKHWSLIYVKADAEFWALLPAYRQAHEHFYSRVDHRSDVPSSPALVLPDRSVPADVLATPRACRVVAVIDDTSSLVATCVVYFEEADGGPPAEAPDDGAPAPDAPPAQAPAASQPAGQPRLCDVHLTRVWKWNVAVHLPGVLPAMGNGGLMRVPEAHRNMVMSVILANSLPVQAKFGSVLRPCAPAP